MSADRKLWERALAMSFKRKITLAEAMRRVRANTNSLPACEASGPKSVDLPVCETSAGVPVKLTDAPAALSLSDEGEDLLEWVAVAANKSEAAEHLHRHGLIEISDGKHYAYARATAKAKARHG